MPFAHKVGLWHLPIPRLGVMNALVVFAETVFALGTGRCAIGVGRGLWLARAGKRY